jgi:hypothetical protein
MDNYINVREVMGAVENRPPLFFDPVGPDRYAAMDRKSITEQIFEEWYRKINTTNTRAIPADLKRLYEDATIALCQILTEEEKIIKGRAE